MKNNMENIKAKALSLFVNYGYESTTIRMICDEVGLSVAGVYVHFKSKKDIFITLFDECIKQYLAYVTTYWKMHATRSHENKIVIIFKAFCMYSLENKEAYAFLIRNSHCTPIDIESEIRNKVEKWHKAINELFNDVFQEFVENYNTKFESKEEIQKLLGIFVNGIPQSLIKTKEDIDTMSLLLLKAIK